MDEVLRTKLWSAVYLVVFGPLAELPAYGITPDMLTQRLWLHFFNKPIDKTPRYEYGEFAEFVRGWFFQCDWYEVYDFIEALLAELRGRPSESLVSLANSFLEAELSAYRIIDGRIAEITSELEIKSIEEGISSTDFLPHVQTHLREALGKLTNRNDPDFRNSIKESISAVEAMCRAITGQEKATLGLAIKRLKDAGVSLHPSLEQGWLKLYGYTSDKGGIRHALTDEAQVGFPEAKYMLVTCTAFTNYLLELVRLGGIVLTPS